MSCVGKAPVTVVIPAWNAARWIPETLASVFSQSFPATEIIVVNDGSPDTPELETAIQPWRSGITYVTQLNGGTSAAKNNGIMRAATPYVATIDSDDLWEPGYIEQQLGLLQREKADIVYCNAVMFDDSPDTGKLFMDVCPSEGEVNYSRLVSLTCHVNTSVLARRQTMVDAGLFDPDFRGSEDFDLWLRIAKSGARFAYTRKPLMRYRVRPNSLSSNQIWMTENFIRVLHKSLNMMALTEEERRVTESQMVRQQGELDVMLGKKALADRRFEDAARHLASASQALGTTKMAIISVLARWAPRLLLALTQTQKASGRETVRT